MNNPLLTVTDLSVILRGASILSQINFSINRGEYFILLGPTGSGKTMLLSAILGAVSHSGCLVIEGRDITSLPIEKRGIGVVYQDHCLFPHMPVYDNIAYPLKIRRKKRGEIKEEVHSIAASLEITGLLSRSIRNLSGGEKQKVAIARTLVTNPSLILLDEPLASIDTGFRKKIQHFLKNIQTRFNVTILHVTHNFNEALFLGDRIAVLNRGKIEQIGPPDHVFNKPETSFVAEFTDTINCITLSRNNGEVFLETISIPLEEVPSDAEKALLHPEDIILSLTPLESSARFSLEARITAVVRQKAHIEIMLDVGFPLVSYISRHSLSKMDLKKGMHIFATFKENSLRYL